MEHLMKNRFFSLTISLTILLLFFSLALFAQNQPKKQSGKTATQMNQTSNQKFVKTNQTEKEQTPD